MTPPSGHAPKEETARHLLGSGPLRSRAVPNLSVLVPAPAQQAHRRRDPAGMIASEGQVKKWCPTESEDGTRLVRRGRGAELTVGIAPPTVHAPVGLEPARMQSRAEHDAGESADF